MQRVDEGNGREEHDGESDADQLNVAGDALARLVQRDEHDEHGKEKQKQRPDDRMTEPPFDLLAQPDHRGRLTDGAEHLVT